MDKFAFKMTVRPISHPEPTTHRCNGSKNNPCPTCGSTTGITRSSDDDDDDNNTNIIAAPMIQYRHQHPILSSTDPAHTCDSLPCTVCGKKLERRSSIPPQAFIPPELRRISISYNSHVANNGAPAAAIMTKTVTNSDGGFEGQVAVSFFPTVDSHGAMIPLADVTTAWPDLI